MRTYEKDTDVKIPNWYLKIPQKILDCICNTGLFINRLLPQVRKKNAHKKTNKRQIKFYL